MSTVALKRAATITLGKMLQNEPKLAADEERPYLRAANVQPRGRLAVDDVKTMWFGAAEAVQLDLRAGDVVVVEGGQGGFGRAAFVDRDLDGWGFQNSINRLRPVGGNDGRFLTYALLSLRESGWIRAYCNIVSMPHLTADKLAALRVPLPEAAEQRAIADYLDVETARIDGLIAEQEALGAALTERRLGVVTHLTDDPGTELIPLGRFIAEIRQGWSPNCDALPADGVEEWGVLKTGCVNGAVFRANENKRLPDDLAPRPDLVIREDEIVMSRASTSELVGSAARVPRTFPRLMLSDLTYGLTIGSSLLPAYAAYALSGRRVRGRIAAVAKGTSSSMQKLSQRDVKEVPVRVPSLAEQRRIVSLLDHQTGRIDELTGGCRELITLLKERRAALITAAVTGKIDVRAS